MKTIKHIVTFLILVVFTSCNSQQKKEAVQENVVELISVSDLQNTDKSVQLIDVRTPQEYAGGYIKNAKNIDFFEDNFIEEMSKFKKEEPIYIYCRSGRRSGKAAKKLRDVGFTKVYDLDGGFMKWKSKGKQITKNQ